MVSKLDSKRRKDPFGFDDIFKDLFGGEGFDGFGDIFKTISEGREVNDADLMKILDDNNKARFQKEIDARDNTDIGTTGSQNEHFDGVSGHDLLADRNGQNDLPLPSADAQPSSKPIKPKKPVTPSKGPVFTSVSQITSYLKVDRIQSEIDAPESDWPLFGLKETGGNGYDFFKVTYPNHPKESRKIAFRVRVDSQGILRINTRNSNVDNIEVFKNLEQIFDYKRWGSEKRNQHNATQGSLGDFLKRILGMGYASWNSTIDDENMIQNKQWPEPVILRFNKKEYRVFLIVDEGDDGTPNPHPKIEGPFPYEDTSNYTEVEVALPLKHYLPNQSDQEALLYRLQQFYRVHTMAPRNIEYSFVNEGLSNK